MSTHKLACVSCSIILDADAFYSDGCPNCPFLNLGADESMIAMCTTENYEGMIALIKPKKSWVAKQQQTSHLKSGIYAMTVNKSLPPDIIAEIEESNIKVIDRNRRSTLTTMSWDFVAQDDPIVRQKRAREDELNQDDNDNAEDNIDALLGDLDI